LKGFVITIKIITIIINGKLTSENTALFSSDIFLNEYFVRFRFGAYLRHTNSHHRRLMSGWGDTDKVGIIILNYTLDK
jgi:hypothetical protein